MRVLISIPVCILLIAEIGASQPEGGIFGVWGKAENPSAGNGITVGQPKVFNNRALVLARGTRCLPEEHPAGGSIKIAGNVGVLQGITQRQTSQLLSVSTLPIPGVQLTDKANPATGALRPDSRVTTQDKVVPTAPPLSDQLSSPLHSKTHPSKRQLF